MLGPPARIRSLVARFRSPAGVSVSCEGAVVLGTSANFYLIIIFWCWNVPAMISTSLPFLPI